MVPHDSFKWEVNVQIPPVTKKGSEGGQEVFPVGFPSGVVVVAHGRSRGFVIVATAILVISLSNQMGLFAFSSFLMKSQVGNSIVWYLGFLSSSMGIEAVSITSVQRIQW
ncbi:hypothetical protein R6Q59_028733 [Mikania micrantha]